MREMREMLRQQEDRFNEKFDELRVDIAEALDFQKGVQSVAKFFGGVLGALLALAGIYAGFHGVLG